MFYFSENNIRGNHAGTKARNDVENILKRLNCKPINSKRYLLKSDDLDNIYSNITNRIELLRYFLDLMKVRNQIVIIQYPMLSFDKEVKYLSRIKQHNRLVFLIHDVHGLKRQNKSEIRKEISLLNMADAIIVHNRFMEKKLIECGLIVKNIYCLNVFDYLYDSNMINKHIEEQGVAFAGNLEKSEFFEQFCKKNPDLNLYLYGQKYDTYLNKYNNIFYCGSFKPDVIPGKLKGKYGLVWDGNSIDTCLGIFGEYTRYNNPHKLSLYIVAAMPVIVWEEAAIAEFVKKNAIGITVKSLTSLQTVLKSISDEDYEKMYNNVIKLRSDLISGNSLKSVLIKIEKEIGG